MVKKAKKNSNAGFQRTTPIVIAVVVLVVGWIGISHLTKSSAATLENLASTSTPGYLCSNYGGGQCASLPPSGTPFSGAGVVTYNISSSWRWYENSKGTVTSSYPFSAGWLNNLYIGKHVVRFQLKANTGYCMANDSDFIVLHNCTSGAPQLWVISGNWLVNVSSSDNHNSKWVMTKSSSQVLSRHGGDWPASQQNWGWIQ